MLDTNLLLAAGASYRKINKGQVIFKEQTDPSFYYQLAGGRLKLVNHNDAGRECLHDFVDAGESFGEIALLLNQCYVVTSVAEEDSIIIRLPKNDFEYLLQQYPEQMKNMLQLVSARLRFKTLLLKELYNYSPASRIKSFINYIKGQKKFICPETQKLLLTRQQIADMTGLRVETVIRTMKSLQKEALVTIDDKGKVYC